MRCGRRRGTFGRCVMRATYGDLLRTARRIAVSAQRGRYLDESEVMTDWHAVLSATKYHLGWLRGRLETTPRGGEPEPGRRSENALGRLAQAIGAGADLLAVQDASASAALDVRDDLVAARAEVAAIALMAASVVVRNTSARARGRSHLRRVMPELTQMANADVRRTGLGGLAGLAAGGPAVLAGDLSVIAAPAARWERVHAAIPPQAVLTRDLRSSTAQLRTIGGFAGYLVSQLLLAPSAGLAAEQRDDLMVITGELRRFR